MEFEKIEYSTTENNRNSLVDSEPQLNNSSDFENSICFSKSIVEILEYEENEGKLNLLQSKRKEIIVSEPIQDDCSIVEIDADRVKEWMENDPRGQSSQISIIDARYPYEYSGGHIRGALNLFTPEILFRHFFAGTMTQETDGRVEEALRQLMDGLMAGDDRSSTTGTGAGASDARIIFHCEFSSARGPRMAEQFRSVDRYAHVSSYPQLFYPNVYILKDGYRGFYSKYPELCEPQSYVPMDLDEIENDVSGNNKADMVHQLVYFKEIVEEQFRILDEIQKQIIARQNENNNVAGEMDQ